MDVKEKLVELLQDENNPVWNWFPNNAAMMQLADYLIANGVTVQEWISVDDRLPEPFTPVLVYRKSFGTLPPYISIDKMVLWNANTQVWTDEIKTWKAVTTHWMPLPEPPKGE